MNVMSSGGKSEPPAMGGSFSQVPGTTSLDVTLVRGSASATLYSGTIRRQRKAEAGVREAQRRR